jgi:hypothetical protein
MCMILYLWVVPVLDLNIHGYFVGIFFLIVGNPSGARENKNLVLWT